jgi:hypothetical protein
MVGRDDDQEVAVKVPAMEFVKQHLELRIEVSERRIVGVVSCWRSSTGWRAQLNAAWTAH